MNSEHPPVSGKFIVTTVTKAHIVAKLSDFWRMKSTLMLAKFNPELLETPEFIDQARSFYKNNSNLMKQPFWNKLSEEAQTRFLQYLILQEVDQAINLRMANSKERAALYIVLSGTAEVKKGSEQEEEFVGPGGLFGAVDLCTKIVDSVEQYRHMDDDALIDEEVMAIKMHKGSYVRIGINDLFRFVFPPDHSEAVQRARAEDSAIAEIPWELLTEDDKFYVTVYKRARDLISKNLFMFLDALRTIPKNAKMPAFKYYYEKEKDREIILDPSDPLNLYLIIDGRIKIEAEALRDDPNGHTLSCQRKGRRPMVIKTNKMPLLLLDSGSTLLLRSETFSVGDPSAAIIIDPSLQSLDDSSHNPSLSRSLTSLTTEATHAFSGAKGLRSSHPSPIPSRMSTPSLTSTTIHNSNHQHPHHPHHNHNEKPLKQKKNNKNDKGKVKEKELFRLKIIFETFTTFLKIPYPMLERVLYDEQMTKREMADSIRDQLAFSNKAIGSRLRNLLPWLLGDKSFAMPPKLPPPPQIRTLESSLLNKLLEQNSTKLFSATVGSFARGEDLKAGDEFSALTSDLTNAIDESLSIVSSQQSMSTVTTRSPRKSKLKDMIESIKSQKVTTTSARLK